MLAFPMFGFYIFLSLSPIFDAFPTQDPVHIPDENSIATTPNATEGLISSVWHKISNIFGSEDTTTEEGEEEQRTGNRNHEVLLPEDRVPSLGGQGSDRELRMAPEDFSRKSADEESAALWQHELEDETNPFLVHRMERSEPDLSKERQQHDHEVRPPRGTERTNSRFDTLKSTNWRTEKIIVESDPVESIDKTNYIEETKDANFPFHKFSLEPIIVEDNLSPDVISRLPQRELPPLKMIDF